MTTLVIQNLEDEVFVQLNQAAEQDGISVEQKAAYILEHFTRATGLKRDEIVERSRNLRMKNAHINTTDSVQLIREDRDK